MKDDEVIAIARCVKLHVAEREAELEKRINKRLDEIEDCVRALVAAETKRHG